MITRDDIIDLLKACAVADQRTVGEEDIRVWALIAQNEKWNPHAAQRVIVQHYSRGADRPRISPAQISDSLRELRRQAAASFEAPVIPAGMSGARYVRWYREQLAEHVERLLGRWADGEDIPLALPQPAPPPDRRVIDAIAGFADRTRIPDDPEIRYRPDPAMRVECPHCGAEPGAQCTRTGLAGRRRLVKPHPSRTEAAS